MGNCIYKVLGLGTPSGEDRDEAWKRQTRGRIENKLYTFVDLKGRDSSAELVQIWKQSGKSNFVRKLKNERILVPYLYEHGDGKEVTAEELKRWQDEQEPEVQEILKLKKNSTDWKYRKNKQHHRKVLLSSFHLNGHTLGFHPQTQS